MVLIAVEIAHWRRAFEWEIERARHFVCTQRSGDKGTHIDPSGYYGVTSMISV
jgi:hypothetical protein